MNKSKGLIIVFVIAIISVVAIVNKAPKEAAAPTISQEETSSLAVYASHYPIAFLAEEISGMPVEIMTKPGVDPHSFSLTPNQRIALERADIFLYNGANFDPWAEELSEDLRESGVTVVEMAEYVNLLENEDEHDDEHEDEDEHGHDGADPHFWLSPQVAQSLVDPILEAFVSLNPEATSDYQRRAADLVQRLQDLDTQFAQGLESCSQDTIIVAHDAYGYLSTAYGFTTESIAGLSPDAEPSAKTFGELQQLAQEKNINYIFFEELASPKLSETLANDIGAQTLVLSPIENLTQEQSDAGETYFTLMQRNLNNLQTALSCS